MMCATICLFVISTPSYAQSNQTVTSGSTTVPVTFPAAGCSYTWTNSDPSIGLPASGTGNIPAFTAKNTGVSTVTATITATPTSVNGFAYITNGGAAGAVSVIDISTDKVVATIPVGSNPMGVAISPDGTRVYVTNQLSATVSVINALTNKVIATYSMPQFSEPSDILISPDGKTLYVADYNIGTISVVNAATGAITSTVVVGNNPWLMALSPDGGILYVTNPVLANIAVINTSSNTITATIPLSSEPTGMTISPDGSRLYVGLYNTNTIAVISTSNYTVVGTAAAGVNSSSNAVTPDGSRVYVSNGYDGTVSVINTADNSTVATIPLGTGTGMINVSRDGSKVYAIGGNQVFVISTQTNSVIATISAGSGLESLGNFVGGCPTVTFKITVNSDPDATFPTITTTAATGTISACAGTASASPNIQQFTVSGSNLTGVITATAPPGFQISFSATGIYGSSVSLAEAAGVTFNTPLYIRSDAKDPAGNISGNVVLSSPGATNQMVAVSGVVNALPTVNKVPNQTVNAGASTTAINFTGTGNTFTWVNNTPSIGLPASGTGNIASFTAVNSGANPVTATITVTPQPGNHVYVANYSSNTVSVVNTANNAVLATINVGTNPWGVSVSADGSKVFVSNQGSNNVSVISTATNTVVATIPVGVSPEGIVATPDGSKVYVTSLIGNSVSVIDVASNSVIAAIPVGSNPIGIAVSPDGSKVFVANNVDYNVTVISTATNTATGLISISDRPFMVLVSTDGSRLYIACTDGILQVASTASNMALQNVAVGAGLTGMAVSPDGARLYIADPNNTAVDVLSTSNYNTINTITAPYTPSGLSMSPDGGTLYVTQFSSNNVSEISTSTGTITATVPVGMTPSGYGNFVIGGPCSGNATTFTITVNSTPSITASTPTGAINACAGTASESPNIEQFTISGSNLTSDITATAPAGFEVSLNSTSGFGNSVAITQSGGNVNGVVVYVRSAASASGSISGNVTLTSPGATTQNVSVSGNINPPLTITPVPNQIVNAGAATTAVVFQGSATTYNWTNSAPAIGLPASGTGNILAFTAINNTGTPITAIITVTPVNSSLNCSGMPVTFTITVNPAVAQSGITAGSATGFILSCEGTPSSSPHIQQVQISGASLTGDITAKAPAGFEISATANGSYGSSLVLTQSAGTLKSTTVYIRSAASAPTGHISGDIILSSPGTSDQTVAVSGLINTIITVDPVPNQTVKAGASTTAVNFTGTAGAYTWSNNTPGIGLPAGGTGNIGAFTAVNTGTTPITATITATPLPTAYAYVPNYVRNVNVINVLTGDMVGSIAAGNSPESVAISQDGRHVYICNLNSDDISVVDGTTNTVTTLIPTGFGSQPYYVALSPDGNTLYAACSASNTVLAISTATNKVISTITVGNHPICITVSPDGQKLYVTNFNDQTISVINTASYAIAGTISLGGLAGYATTINSGGSRLYVAVSGASSQVLVIDTTTGKVVASIPVATSAQSIVITPDDTKLYVTDSNANTVTVISTATNSIITTISVDNGPFGIAVSPDGSLVCVTNGNGNDVAVISTATDKVVRIVHAASALGLGNFVTGSTGCTGPSVTFTITVNPIGPPSFTASADLQGLTTTYGTPSPSESFTITGANLTGGVSVKAPPGFEVSTDNTNFSTTVTVGGTGDLAATKVYIRLAATTPVGTYSGNILLTSPGTPDINVAMPASTVTKAMLIITADNQTKPLGAPNPELTVSYKGFVDGDNQGQLTTLPVATTIATTSSAPGQYVITVDGAKSPNYDFTYVNGTLTILPSLQTAIIPNAFTPNGDGVNDYWDIPELADFPACIVSIYTRYGSLVFQSRGYGKPWDGTSKGSPVPMGTYYYIIDPRQDNIKPISGYVAVIR